MSPPKTRCPVCHGEIHAIASRCKYCKTDLLVESQRRAEARRRSESSLPPPVPESAPPAAPRAESSPPTPQPAPPATPAGVAFANTDAEDTIPEAARVEQPRPAAATATEPARLPSSRRAQREFRLEPRPAAVRPRRAWHRNWPAAAFAVAFLGIGFSVGVLTERWRKSSFSEPPRTMRAPQVSGSPNAMPTPILPPSVTPLPPAQTEEESNRSAPETPVTEFLEGVTDGICNALERCGYTPRGFDQAQCQLIGQSFASGDIAERVERGECRFDAEAASSCLEEIDRLSCSFSASHDLQDWFLAADRLDPCQRAVSCS